MIRNVDPPTPRWENRIILRYRGENFMMPRQRTKIFIYTRGERFNKFAMYYIILSPTIRESELCNKNKLLCQVRFFLN